jgi:hypothetical protein
MLLFHCLLYRGQCIKGVTVNKYQKDAIAFTMDIKYKFWQLYILLHESLSRPDKSFEINYDGTDYHLYPPTTEIEQKEQYELRNELINCLLHDAAYDMIDTLPNSDDYHEIDHWGNIIALVSGEDPSNHQFEIVKSEVVDNLDADGNPISAKPLDHDSVYVQWQDENKFKFEENNV